MLNHRVGWKHLGWSWSWLLWCCRLLWSRWSIDHGYDVDGDHLNHLCWTTGWGGSILGRLVCTCREEPKGDLRLYVDFDFDDDDYLTIIWCVLFVNAERKGDLRCIHFDFVYYLFQYFVLIFIFCVDFDFCYILLHDLLSTGWCRCDQFKVKITCVSFEDLIFVYFATDPQ